MHRALGVLGLACAGSAAAAYYAHWQQRSEKARMHAGVLRDLAREEAEKTAASQTLQGVLPAAEVPPCEGDVCSLSVKRTRGPV